MSTNLSVVDELRQAALYESNESKRATLEGMAGKVAELVRADRAFDAATAHLRDANNRIVAGTEVMSRSSKRRTVNTRLTAHARHVAPPSQP